MPMRPFIDRFPIPGIAETRSLKLTGHASLPDGEYGFIEMYCDERECDCRRVMVAVLRPRTGWSKVWATISYGWEDAGFYRAWGPHSDPLEMQGPNLNPLGPQSRYSHALLELFRTLIESPEYIERLKRHYAMFREAIGREHGAIGRVLHEHGARRRGRGSQRGRPRGL